LVAPKNKNDNFDSLFGVILCQYNNLIQSDLKKKTAGFGSKIRNCGKNEHFNRFEPKFHPENGSISTNTPIALSYFLKRCILKFRNQDKIITSLKITGCVMMSQKITLLTLMI
jgi:hypothetical protein